jgi:hypothetical protein
MKASAEATSVKVPYAAVAMLRLAHQILGELLRAFDLGSGATDRRSAMPAAAQASPKTGHERHFRTAHHQSTFSALASFTKIGNGLGPDIGHGDPPCTHAAAQGFDTGITRRRDQHDRREDFAEFSTPGRARVRPSRPAEFGSP